jgi:hypothetical protein
MEACHWLQGQAPAGTLDAVAWAREAAPDAWPTWDSIQQKDEESSLSVM